MKTRFKKAILLTILGSFGIGILSLSIILDRNNVPENKDISTFNDYDILIPTVAAPPSPTTTIAPTPTQLPTLPPTPTSELTPTTLPVYSLKKDGFPKITALIKAYYDAKINCDIDNFKGILSEPSNIASPEQLKEDIMYVEDYQAIKCYVKKSYEDGAYIVYACHDIKFLNIDTPAPAVDCFYIITDNEGKLKIFSGEFDEDTKAYYFARNEDADVQELIHETNKNGDKAKEKDELLRIFWDGSEASQENQGDFD